MTAKAETCIKALRALAWNIQSDDGVANAALDECADRMERMEKDNNRLTTANLQLREGVEALKQRINQLEQENDALRADLLLWSEKEAKP